jgi:hypothetical protein
MAEDNTCFEKLATKIDSGFAEMKPKTTMLEWMNAALIIKTLFA